MYLNNNIILSIIVYCNKENLNFYKSLFSEIEKYYEKNVRRIIVDINDDSVIYDFYEIIDNIRIKEGKKIFSNILTGLNIIENFKNNLLHGDNYKYENNILVKYTQFINGNKSGKCFYRASFGNTITLEFKNNKKNGEYIKCDIKGKIIQKCYFKDDKLNGSYFFDDKEKYINCYYIDDKLESKYEEYYVSTGTLRERKWYNNGYLQGEFLHYSENGNLLEKSNYINGALNGECIKLNNNGFYETINYENGIK